MHPLALLLLPALVTTAAPAWPDVASTPLVTGGGDSDAAVIVGVEKYFAVAPIPNAEKNAKDWYGFFTRGRGVRPGNVKLLLNEQATREDILEAAANAKTWVKPGGTLWFVFIGHGAPTKDGSDGVLVGVDAQQRPTSLYGRSVGQRELAEALKAPAGTHTVMVLDACFSGRTSEGKPLIEGLQPLIAARAAPPSDVTVMTAGTSDQFAGPLPEGDRPAFSYLVLGALRGWGDANHDGSVTAREAVSYAEETLRALLVGRQQTPQLFGADLPLSMGSERGPDVVERVIGPAPTPVEPPKPMAEASAPAATSAVAAPTTAPAPAASSSAPVAVEPVSEAIGAAAFRGGRTVGSGVAAVAEFSSPRQLGLWGLFALSNDFDLGLNATGQYLPLSQGSTKTAGIGPAIRWQALHRGTFSMRLDLRPRLNWSKTDSVTTSGTELHIGILGASVPFNLSFGLRPIDRVSLDLSLYATPVYNSRDGEASYQGTPLTKSERAFSTGVTLGAEVAITSTVALSAAMNAFNWGWSQSTLLGGSTGLSDEELPSASAYSGPTFSPTLGLVIRL